MQKLNKLVAFIRRQPRWRQVTAAIIIVLAGWWWWHGGGTAAAKIPTFTTRRGSLEINVLEGGSLQALESQEVKCEVRVGYQGTKILRIVEEGYQVTDEDVKTNKVLVELDSSDLEKQISQQEIEYQQAVASLIDAQQDYEIQLNQNQSDIKTAEQKARFGRMDFDKFLGDTVTAQIIKDYGLDKILTEATTGNVEDTSHAAEAGMAKVAAPPSVTEPLAVRPAGGVAETNTVAATATNNPPKLTVTGTGGETNANAPLKISATGVSPLTNLVAGVNTNISSATPVAFPTGLIDFTKYANIDALGDGEAKQKLRKFEDDLQAAQKELGQAKATLEGTRRLYDKQFVAKTELVRDQLSQDSAELKVQTAETDRALFLKYDFSKTAEQSLSTYTEAVRELDKARRVAISKLAQAQAKLKSAQGQYEVQTRQRKELNEQLDKCTIHAQKSGLVVYGGAGDNMYYGNQDPIREGATVRERQAIITIPDMSRMSVNVKIHESYIKKIKKGQKVRITVDAFPDTVLGGEVTKVGILPDSQNRWMNPDLKVYNTTITVTGTYDWVKPGMSAKVEILVSKLDDVVYVPVQAISPSDGKQVCYVAGAFKPERREVEIGDFNDEFIEIKHGLKEGDHVLLRLPDGVETGGSDKSSPAKEQKPAEPAKQSAPPSRRMRLRRRARPNLRQPMPSPIVHFNNVRKTYQMGPNTVEALRGVTFGIEAGDYVSIMGPSGCGKSTLLNLLGCLDRPSTGHYLLGGQDVSAMDDDALSAVRGTRLGFIFQSYNLIQQLTVVENIEIPLYYQDRPEDECRERASKFAALVGLNHRLDHKPFELSGGQQQRVAIARALVNDPLVILADEPTGNLDSTSGVEIMKVFDELHAEGKTLIIVTHDPNVGRRAKRTIRLRDGHIESDVRH